MIQDCDFDDCMEEDCVDPLIQSERQIDEDNSSLG